MTHSLYHIKAAFYITYLQKIVLDGIRLFDILVKQASLYQSLISYPQNKPTIFIVSYVPQFIYSNPGIGCRFFQTKITLFPDGNFFHMIVSY